MQTYWAPGCMKSLQTYWAPGCIKSLQTYWAPGCMNIQGGYFFFEVMIKLIFYLMFAYSLKEV